MCSVCFAPSSLLFLSSSASTFLVIFQNTWNILSHYAILFLFITFSPVLTAVPLSTPKSRGLLWSHWERVCLIPSLRKEKNWTRLGCGGAGAFTPHPHPPMPPPCPTPPTMGGQKATPSPDFIPLPTFPISLPAVCSHFPGSYCVTIVPVITEIMKFALTLLK